MADLDKLESGGAVVIGDISDNDSGGGGATELEGISVLDFDLLCSTVALQTQGKWRKLESSEEEDAVDDEFSGGVFRLWEGDVMDCFEDRHLCIESAWLGYLFLISFFIRKTFFFKLFLRKFWDFPHFFSPLFILICVLIS